MIKIFNDYPISIQEKIMKLGLSGKTYEEILLIAINDCSVLMKELTLESNWNQDIKSSIGEIQSGLLKHLYSKK